MKKLKWTKVNDKYESIGEYIYMYSKLPKGFLLVINKDGLSVVFRLRTEKACKDIAHNLEFK